MNEAVMEEEEISLVDIFRIFWNRRKLIVGLTVLCCAAALGYALYAPSTYKGECFILPPNPNKSRMGSLVAQMGGLADLVGLPATATSGQLMIWLLKSNTIVDAIIDKYSLMEVYEEEIRLSMRKIVVDSILEVEEDSKSGVVTVGVVDRDPAMAAEMANAFVEELQKKLQELSLGEAGQRRMFFEVQLKQSQEALGEAEDAMLRYQQESGVVVLEPQMRALLDSITNLRNQIAEKNVEISALRTYAKSDNPRLKQAQSQLVAMNRELSRLEEEQKKTNLGSSEGLSSLRQAPELGLEYQRYARNLQFATTMYEVMLKQFESAKLDEAKDFAPLQVLDPATPPDYKYRPRRGRMIIIGTALGFFLGCAWAFLADYIRSLKETGEL